MRFLSMIRIDEKSGQAPSERLMSARRQKRLVSSTASCIEFASRTA